jgi:hypothetical protein
MALTMQLHAGNFIFPTMELPKRLPSFPTIHMPIGNEVAKSAGTFKGKLYAKKVRRRLKNMNTHTTRIFKGGHRYKFSLDVKLPKRKIRQITLKEENLKNNRTTIKIPEIKLSCYTKFPPRSKDIDYLDEGREYISQTLKLDEKEYSGTFSLFRITKEIKDSNPDYNGVFKTPKSEALRCVISIKENQGKKSEYDYVDYTLSFFDYGMVSQ